MLKQTTNNEQLTDIETAQHVLRLINWNFSNPFNVGRSGVKLFDARRHHWYPATFIPELPYTLIELLTKKGACVYDPFGGIGTTTFQSLMLGRNVYSTDNCYVAVECVRSMLVLISTKKPINELMSEIETVLNKRIKVTTKKLAYQEELAKWYNKDTYLEIDYLRRLYHAVESVELKCAIKIALSSTAKAVCAQDRGWGCISDNVIPQKNQMQKYKNAIARFRTNINILLKDISITRTQMPRESISYIRKTSPDKIVIKSDVSEHVPLPASSIDIVISSPPYPNMSDYSLGQRLSYYLFDCDISADTINEIGARRYRSSSSSIDKYVTRMGKAIINIVDAVKRGGFICIILPEFDGKNDLVRKNAIQKVLLGLKEYGCEEIVNISRTLPVRRRHHNQNWTSLTKEQIHFYRKDK